LRRRLKESRVGGEAREAAEGVDEEGREEMRREGEPQQRGNQFEKQLCLFSVFSLI
jgi:hypothetical protein